MTTIYGMAVLVVRITFVVLSYYMLRTLDWHKAFTERNYYMAQYVCILLSIAIGHLVGSFFVELIEIIRNLLFSAFL